MDPEQRQQPMPSNDNVGHVYGILSGPQINKNNATRQCQADAANKALMRRRNRQCGAICPLRGSAYMGSEDGPPAGRFAPNIAATERWPGWKRFAEDKLQGL